MKRLSFLALAVVLLFAVTSLAATKEYRLARDYEWANDPRSLALTTEGLEEFLAVEPVPRQIAAFGDLLDEWTWAQIGISSYYAGADISIDYPYLYLCNQRYSRLYVCNISSGTPVSPTYVFAAGSMPWGAGMDNDPNFWMGSYRTRYNYEYTTYPPSITLTGNRFYNYKGYAWMGGISDNCPLDTLFQLRVGSNNHIYAFGEPNGATGRNFGHIAWDYISQRGLTWNRDDGTFVLGGWNSGKVWECAYSDGAPIPGRSFTPTMWQVAGLAYQDESYDGTAKLWLQTNWYNDVLQVYHFPKLHADDIGVMSIDQPDFPYVDDSPFDVKAVISNLGTAAQTFDTWVEIDDGSTIWTSTTISTSLASFTSATYTYQTFPNGRPVGTVFDVCVYVDNPGDEDTSNDNMCATFKILRTCIPFVSDRFPAMWNIFYYYDYGTILAKEMRTTDTRPATMVWVGVNSKGEQYYPWPDPVYDPIMIGCWTDDDLSGKPENDPAWADTVTPTDMHWVTAEVPPCTFLGSGGGVWVGWKNISPGREGMVVDPLPRQNYNDWYYYPPYGEFRPYSGFSDFHIRGCLEYPPLVSVSGLGSVSYTPPKPWIRAEYAKVDFSLTACGTVIGNFSATNLLHASLPIMIPSSNIFFDPPSFSMVGGQTLNASMYILIPVGQHEGDYNGSIAINHLSGVETIPFTLTVEIDPDLDVDDNGGNVSGNVMNLMGVRGGVAVGTFKLVNPSSFATNVDQFDGPANCDLFRGNETHGDLDFCAGGPDPKEPIPASMMTVNLIKTALESGEGTYGIVQINIPDWAKHWHQQYDFGYCATVDVTYEDRVGSPASDGFSIYLKVLKAHGTTVTGFWGEHEGAANVLHWSDLGLSEEGYALYRDGARIAEIVGEYEYADPIVNT
ncbi:MAG: hypothetical protein ACE5JA_05160, partial [bacterium]